MNIKDLILADDGLRFGSGVQVIYSIRYDLMIVVNTDITVQKGHWGEDSYPGISENLLISSIIYSSPWTDRRSNVYVLSAYDFIMLYPKKLNKTDLKRYNGAIDKVMGHLTKDKKHSKYFYIKKEK